MTARKIFNECADMTEFPRKERLKNAWQTVMINEDANGVHITVMALETLGETTESAIGHPTIEQLQSLRDMYDAAIDAYLLATENERDEQ